jgi:hypothetical protein
MREAKGKSGGGLPLLVPDRWSWYQKENPGSVLQI